MEAFSCLQREEGVVKFNRYPEMHAPPPAAHGLFHIPSLHYHIKHLRPPASSPSIFIQWRSLYSLSVATLPPPTRHVLQKENKTQQPENIHGALCATGGGGFIHLCMAHLRLPIAYVPQGECMQMDPWWRWWHWCERALAHTCTCTK